MKDLLLGHYRNVHSRTSLWILSQTPQSSCVCEQYISLLCLAPIAIISIAFSIHTFFSNRRQDKRLDIGSERFGKGDRRFEHIEREIDELEEQIEKL